MFTISLGRHIELTNTRQHKTYKGKYINKKFVRLGAGCGEEKEEEEKK